MKKLIVLFTMIGSLNAQGSGKTSAQTYVDILKIPQLGKKIHRPKPNSVYKAYDDARRVLETKCRTLLGGNPPIKSDSSDIAECKRRASAFRDSTDSTLTGIEIFRACILLMANVQKIKETSTFFSRSAPASCSLTASADDVWTKQYPIIVTNCAENQDCKDMAAKYYLFQDVRTKWLACVGKINTKPTCTAATTNKTTAITKLKQGKTSEAITAFTACSNASCP